MDAVTGAVSQQLSEVLKKKIVVTLQDECDGKAEQIKTAPQPHPEVVNAACQTSDDLPSEKITTVPTVQKEIQTDSPVSAPPTKRVDNNESVSLAIQPMQKSMEKFFNNIELSDCEFKSSIESNVLELQKRITNFESEKEQDINEIQSAMVSLQSCFYKLEATNKKRDPQPTHPIERTVEQFFYDMKLHEFKASIESNFLDLQNRITDFELSKEDDINKIHSAVKKCFVDYETKQKPRASQDIQSMQRTMDQFLDDIRFTDSQFKASIGSTVHNIQRKIANSELDKQRDINEIHSAIASLETGLLEYEAKNTKALTKGMQTAFTKFMAKNENGGQGVSGNRSVPRNTESTRAATCPIPEREKSASDNTDRQEQPSPLDNDESLKKKGIYIYNNTGTISVTNGDHFSNTGTNTGAIIFGGSVSNTHDDHFSNTGTITFGDHFSNTGTITHDDHFSNTGTITHDDHFSNTGTITFGDHFSNTGTSGTVTFGGTVTRTRSHPFNNTGTTGPVYFDDNISVSDKGGVLSWGEPMNNHSYIPQPSRDANIRAPNHGFYQAEADRTPQKPSYGNSKYDTTHLYQSSSEPAMSREEQNHFSDSQFHRNASEASMSLTERMEQRKRDRDNSFHNKAYEPTTSLTERMERKTHYPDTSFHQKSYEPAMSLTERMEKQNHFSDSQFHQNAYEPSMSLTERMERRTHYPDTSFHQKSYEPAMSLRELLDEKKNFVNSRLHQPAFQPSFTFTDHVNRRNQYGDTLFHRSEYKPTSTLRERVERRSLFPKGAPEPANSVREQLGRTKSWLNRGYSSYSPSKPPGSHSAYTTSDPPIIKTLMKGVEEMLQKSTFLQKTKLPGQQETIRAEVPVGIRGGRENSSASTCAFQTKDSISSCRIPPSADIESPGDACPFAANLNNNARGSRESSQADRYIHPDDSSDAFSEYGDTETDTVAEDIPTDVEDEQPTFSPVAVLDQGLHVEVIPILMNVDNNENNILTSCIKEEPCDEKVTLSDSGVEEAEGTDSSAGEKSSSGSSSNQDDSLFDSSPSLVVEDLKFELTEHTVKPVDELQLGEDIVPSVGKPDNELQVEEIAAPDNIKLEEFKLGEDAAPINTKPEEIKFAEDVVSNNTKLDESEPCKDDAIVNTKSNEFLTPFNLRLDAFQLGEELIPLNPAPRVVQAHNYKSTPVEVFTKTPEKIADHHLDNVHVEPTSPKKDMPWLTPTKPETPLTKDFLDKLDQEPSSVPHDVQANEKTPKKNVPWLIPTKPETPIDNESKVFLDMLDQKSSQARPRASRVRASYLTEKTPSHTERDAKPDTNTASHITKLDSIPSTEPTAVLMGEIKMEDPKSPMANLDVAEDLDDSECKKTAGPALIKPALMPARAYNFYTFSRREKANYSDTKRVLGLKTVFSRN